MEGGSRGIGRERRVEVDDDPRQPTPTTSHPRPLSPLAFATSIRRGGTSVWKASRYGMRANNVLSLFAEKRARRDYRARGMIRGKRVERGKEKERQTDRERR